MTDPRIKGNGSEMPSDKPSDNDPRHQQTERDATGLWYYPGLR
jgi:hypothetical protein